MFYSHIIICSERPDCKNLYISTFFCNLFKVTMSGYPSCLCSAHAPIILQPLKVIISDLVTATASAILVLFDSAAFSANVFTFRFEITLMTGSAEGRICG